jgi:hypothetical protein
VSIRVAIAQINPKLGDLQANLSLYDEKVCQGMKNRSMIEDRRSRMAILDPPSSILEIGVLR